MDPHPHTNADHPSAGELRALIAGTLSGDALARVEQHLNDCSSCADQLDKIAVESQLSRDETLLKTVSADEMDPELVNRIRVLANQRADGDEDSPTMAATFDSALTYEGTTLSGGLGEVGLYRDAKLNRVVAVKSLRRDKPSSFGRVYRFRREYQVTSALQHPGVPAVFGKGQFADGREFYVMQYIKGQTLLEKIQTLHATDRVAISRGNQEFTKLIEQFIDICDTLRAAHKQGILHRDLKPENIVIDDDDRAVVLDWGLAGFAQFADEPVPADEAPSDSPSETTDSDDKLRLTADKHSLGTIAWMSTEQAAGLSRDYDQQTDVYGLGAVLFNILTGIAPHSDEAGGWQSTPADSSEDSRQKSVRLLNRLAQIAGGRQPEVTHPRGHKIPPELVSICRAAMHPDKKQRTRTATALADQLRAWLTMSAVPVHRYTAYQRWSRLLGRYPAVIALSVGLLLSIFTALWAMNANRQQVLQSELKGRMDFIAETATRLNALYEDLEERSRRLYSQQSDEEKLIDLIAATPIDSSNPTDSDEAGVQLEPRVAIGTFVLKAHDLLGEISDIPSARNAIEQSRMHVYLAGIAMVEHKDWSTAHEHYDKALAIVDEAIESQPRPRDLASLLLVRSGLESGTCLLLRRQERLEEAELWLTRSQKSLDELRQYRPRDDVQILRETLVMLERRAELLKANGYLSEAIVLLQQACTIVSVDDLRRWKDQQLIDNGWIIRQDLVIALRDANRAEESVPFLEDLKAIHAASPRGNDPQNFTHRLDECRITKLAADLDFELDQNDNAIAKLEAVIEPLTQLMEADPGNSEPRYLLSAVEAKLGMVYLDLDQPEVALPHMERDWELTQIELQATGGNDPQTVNDAASVTLRRMAQIYAALDQHEQAMETFQKARQLLPGPDEPMTREAYIALQTVLQAWAEYHSSRSEFDGAIERRKELGRAARHFMERDPDNLRNLENVARNTYFTGVYAMEKLSALLPEADDAEIPSEQVPLVRAALDETLQLRLAAQAELQEIIDRVEKNDFREGSNEDPDRLRQILESMTPEIEQLQAMREKLTPADE